MLWGSALAYQAVRRSDPVGACVSSKFSWELSWWHGSQGIPQLRSWITFMWSSPEFLIILFGHVEKHENLSDIWICRISGTSFPGYSVYFGYLTEIWLLWCWWVTLSYLGVSPNLHRCSSLTWQRSTAGSLRGCWQLITCDVDGWIWRWKAWYVWFSTVAWCTINLR